MDSTPLEILFEDEHIIAINKPHGLLVHRSTIAQDATEFALQKVRKMVNHRVHPVHRLDRKTSGVLVFAKNQEVNREIQKLFATQKIDKGYKAIVRGHLLENQTIDYPLKNRFKVQDALSIVEPVQLFEIDVPSSKFTTSRYSLVNIRPKTGRHHQIRKHLAHIFHPVIGDRPHGCNKQNRIWKERFGMTTMMLHAEYLTFIFRNKRYSIRAEPSKEFNRVLGILSSSSS